MHGFLWPESAQWKDRPRRLEARQSLEAHPPQSDKLQIMSPGSVLIQWTYFESALQVLFGSSLGFDSRWLCASITAASRSAAHRAFASLWLSFSSRIVLCCSWSFFFCFSITCCWKAWRLWKWLMQMGFAFWLLVLSFSLLSGCGEGSTSRVLWGFLSDVFKVTFWRETCKMLSVGLPRWGLGIQPLLPEAGFSHKRGMAVTWGRRRWLYSSAIYRTALWQPPSSSQHGSVQWRSDPAPQPELPCAPSLAASEATGLSSGSHSENVHCWPGKLGGRVATAVWTTGMGQDNEKCAVIIF